MNDNVFQHFRPEEHPFIELARDWLSQVSINYSPVLTPFLDPRQLFILKSLIGKQDDIQLTIDGGHQDAERSRVLLYPDYYTPTQVDFELALVEIHYPTKFAEFSHGQILGSLMGIGLKREYYGDILTDGFRWQFFVQQDMLNFVMTQLDKVGKVKVKLTECELDQIVEGSDTWFTETITASSLRLDVIIATVFKFSRQRAKVLIEGNKVKVNWVTVTKLDFPIDSLDVISIRGFGRIRLEEVKGRTKKDKIRLDIGVLRK